MTIIAMAKIKSFFFFFNVLLRSIRNTNIWICSLFSHVSGDLRHLKCLERSNMHHVYVYQNILKMF